MNNCIGGERWLEDSITKLAKISLGNLRNSWLKIEFIAEMIVSELTTNKTIPAMTSRRL